VGIQLILVALVIAFPNQVTMFLDKQRNIDLDKVKIELQEGEAPSQKSSDDAENDIMKSFGGKK